MLFSKKILALATGLGSLVLTHALTPLQVTMRHVEYEQLGFRILQSKNVEGYSVRIKEPKSCEEGVQVSFLSLSFIKKKGLSLFTQYSSTLDISINMIQMITFSFTFLNPELTLLQILPSYG